MTLAIALLVAATTGAPASPAAGDRVRIEEAAGGRRFTARVTEVQQGALVVHTDDQGLRRLELSSLRRLEVSRGRRGHFGRGARVGLVVGAALGALVLAADNNDKPDPDCTCDVIPPALLAGTLVASGALYGGLAGLVIRRERWEAVPLLPGPTARLAPTIAAVPGGVRVGLTLRLGPAPRAR